MRKVNRTYMSTEKIASKINELLPERQPDVNLELHGTREDAVREKAEDLKRRQTARELAELRYREKVRLKREQEKLAEQEKRLEAGIPIGRTDHQHKLIQEKEALVATIEAIEEQNSAVPDLIKSSMPTRITPEQASVLQTTTRQDVVKLLSSLNININLQLTKTDTANLLACLLTCNEAQLNALYKNKKIPVAIKTVIKRILDDANNGYMGTIESLWDRVFGKTGMTLDLPQQQAQATGIIPGTPISREAYIILRDTLIK